jgi:hypothetical protein
MRHLKRRIEIFINVENNFPVIVYNRGHRPAYVTFSTARRPTGSTNLWCLETTSNTEPVMTVAASSSFLLFGHIVLKLAFVV